MERTNRRGKKKLKKKMERCKNTKVEKGKNATKDMKLTIGDHP